MKISWDDMSKVLSVLLSLQNYSPEKIVNKHLLLWFLPTFHHKYHFPRHHHKDKWLELYRIGHKIYVIGYLVIEWCFRISKGATPFIDATTWNSLSILDPSSFDKVLCHWPVIGKWDKNTSEMDLHQFILLVLYQILRVHGCFWSFQLISSPLLNHKQHQAKGRASKCVYCFLYNTDCSVREELGLFVINARRGEIYVLWGVLSMVIRILWKIFRPINPNGKPKPIPSH